MSQSRQSVTIDEKDLLIRTLGLKLFAGHNIHGHAHSWGQVIFASRGVMQVDADGCRWTVPPMRCLWVPAGVEHQIRIIAETWMRTIYVKPELASDLPANCTVLNVSPLLREVILETLRLGMLWQQVAPHAHLTAVLIDQLLTANEMQLKIKMPLDRRALRLADAISDDPADRTPLNDLARIAGASARTLERLFVEETGLSVGRWRQQARLMMAVRLLIEGAPVNHAAFASGYENPSAFVAMFRREMGITPGQYLRGLRSE